MKNVPNPFKLLDDFVLDRVFNPLTWYIEYRTGKDAMDVRVAATYIAMSLLASLAVYEKSIIFFVLLLVLITVHELVGFTVVRSRWRHNNKTGKNIGRLEDFATRKIYDVIVLLNIVTPVGDWVSDILGIAGFTLIFFVCSYLDATDSMPPTYHQPKLVPQT